MKSRARNRVSPRGQETIPLSKVPFRRQARRQRAANLTIVTSNEASVSRLPFETPTGEFEYACEDTIALVSVELLDEGFDEFSEDWRTLAERSGSKSTQQGRWAFWDSDMAE